MSRPGGYPDLSRFGTLALGAEALKPSPRPRTRKPRAKAELTGEALKRTRKPRAKAPSEATEARKFVAWLELNGYKGRFTHIPSGVDLSSMAPDVRYRVIAKLKSEGWRPGWPDYVIALRTPADGFGRDGEKRSCFVELKKRGGKADEKQLDVIGMLPNAKVCVTADEAIAWVQKCEAR